jgi:hypothetical protein
VRATIILIVTSTWEMFTQTGCPDDHPPRISKHSRRKSNRDSRLRLPRSANRSPWGRCTSSLPPDERLHLGLNKAPVVLITASTPGDENAPGVGFRGNDGTGYFGLDQAYPISANGLLFDVDTTTAQQGDFPLFAIWSNGTGYDAAFTGNVGGTEYDNLQGSAMASAAGAVPEPPRGRWAYSALEASASWARKRAAPTG